MTLPSKAGRFHAIFRFYDGVEKGFSTQTQVARGTFDSIDAGLKEGAAAVDETEAANRLEMRGSGKHFARLAY